MYNFVDTIEASESALLPSEALQINGEYIENLIPGYRTLSVSGREALSPDVMSYETGVRDGSNLQYKRYPERIIVVEYQLIAETNEAFRAAYNELGRILDVTDAELIFNDELDKFFVGTPCIIGRVTPGKNAVVGEFEILCTDPFKYSVVEYEAEPTPGESTIMIDYNGTYKSFPTLEAAFYEEDENTDSIEEGSSGLTGDGDCGYVAFFNEHKKIIQLGDPEETDTETYAKSQTLSSWYFRTSGGWGTNSKLIWAANDGDIGPNAVSEVGTLGMKAYEYTYTEPETTTGTILNNKKSAASTPVFYYTVKAKAYDRTETAVKVEFSITASMGTSSNYFGNGLGLVASIYDGSKWHDVTLKKTSAYWKGKSGHTVNKTITFSGLSANTASLTGLKFKVTRSDSYGDAGKLSETACSNLAISKYVAPTPSAYCLRCSNYGTGDKWHGASISRVLKADAAGDVGAANFTFSYIHKFSIGSGKNADKEIGSFQVTLSDKNGKAVAGIIVHKNSKGKKGTLRFIVNNKIVQTVDVDMSYGNKKFALNKTSTITKAGKKVTFNIGGTKKTFNNAAIASTAVTKMTISMATYGTNTPLSYNGLYYTKFVKNNCDTFEDIVNKFSANDIVEANCKNGEILLNGVPEPMYGALGNDWEGFYLTPGLNQIGYSYSDWVEDDYAPAVKVRYREVFL